MDKYNRIEDPEIKWQNYVHLSFDKRGKNIHLKKAFSTKSAGQIGFLPAKEFDSHISPCTKKSIYNGSKTPETLLL